MEYNTTESREPRGVEEVGCKIYSGAPVVSQSTRQIDTDLNCVQVIFQKEHS